MASWGEGGGCNIEGSGRVKAEIKASGSSAGSRLRALGSLNPKTFIFRGPGLMLARGYGLENLRVYVSMAEVSGTLLPPLVALKASARPSSPKPS